VEDGTETPISSQRWKWIGGVGWLRDGSGLVITASDQQAGAQSQQVWQLSYPGGEAQKITNDLSGYRGMSLAADSTTILTLQQNTSSSVWVAPADDYSKARQLTRGSYDGGLGVSWAPDGSILYSSRSGGTDQIWIMDADGNNQKQLTTGPAMKRSPAATPDGRYIVFYAFGPETQISNIWRMDIDGGNPKQLTKGNTDGWPQCSADSKWVLYTDHDSPTSYTTWKVAIEGGEAVPLTATASANSAISPDGTLVACANWDHNPNKLAIIPFAGGPPLKLFDVPADIHYSSLRWRADGGAVSYNLDQGSKVWIQPLNGGPAGELLDFQPDWVWLSDWSRDGKQLVIARGRTTSDAVLISNFR
ncbi:MAG TPA: DPP IV N-terminal domain-containing protein, partial [Pyrinomonadaceae bacterium]|nr:DPP IV N-terminal domain-containing protein [Pyrinomonadaceae bacterium]